MYREPRERRDRIEIIMAFTDRSSVARDIAPPSPRRVKELFAASLLLALTATLALRAFVSLDALAPLVASLLFALATLMVVAAALVPRNPARRASWRDAAGVLTVVGVGITLLIEPDQMVRLVTLSDQPE
jgi:hypothetical protein